MDFETITADLETEAVRGYLPDGRYVNIPLISHIVDNLYVGGCNQGADLGDFFDVIFSMYQRKTYTLAEGTAVFNVRMSDSDHVDTAALAEVVPTVHAALLGGGNVLVNCQAGINRSNLVAALVLRDWKGMTSAEAIALLRERRDPLVLANDTFVDYLMGLDQAE